MIDVDAEVRKLIKEWLEAPPVDDPQAILGETGSIDKFNELSADNLIAYLKENRISFVYSLGN
jgi:hypothetical protein